MIDVKELRIGNYVTFKSRKDPNSFVRIDSMCEWEGGENLMPIPLTPELLIECGFKKCSCGGWKSEIHIDNELTFQYSFGQRLKLKYLHQLQNLYYSLTETELQVNLENPKLQLMT